MPPNTAWRLEPLVLRFLVLKLLYPGFHLLDDLARLRGAVGEQLLGLLILRAQRERLEAGLRALERSHASFHLGSYRHPSITLAFFRIGVKPRCRIASANPR